MYAAPRSVDGVDWRPRQMRQMLEVFIREVEHRHFDWDASARSPPALRVRSSKEPGFFDNIPPGPNTSAETDQRPCHERMNWCLVIGQ